MRTFKRYSVAQFKRWIRSVKVKRRINHIQIHHTYRPRKSDYLGERTIRGMYNYHTQTRGWRDIAQHFTVSPDGYIWDGRSLELDPAGIAGHNRGGLMFEIIGNFDKGEERLEGRQLQAVAQAVAACQDRFGLGDDRIVFHREYAAKSCPGSGISKGWFLDQVRRARGVEKEASVNIAVQTDSVSPVEEKSESYQPRYWKGEILRRGSRGGKVIDLQRLLDEKGFSPGQIDGLYGPKTEEAVRRVQQAGGIAVDGIAGPETYRVLTSDQVVVSGSTSGEQAGWTGEILRRGNRGAKVRDLQGLLAERGFHPGPIDGIYGSKTEEAVRRAQRSGNIAVDGIAGPQTHQVLTSGNLAGWTGEILRRGNRGAKVRDLQGLLAERGFHPGPIDGIYGSKTEEAVRRAQRSGGIAVDGIAGPDTYRILMSSSLD